MGLCWFSFWFFNAIFHNSILVGIINGTGLLLGGLAYETYKIKKK
jgi:hypothetical protein